MQRRKRVKIGVCDDEPIIALTLSKLVKQCFLKLKMDVQINIYNSGEGLLQKIEELDTVFLDIEMPMMDGIEVGKVIKERNETCKIIMATGKVDRFKESFKINAFRFITKPFEIEEIEEAIDAILKLKVGENVISLFLNRIQYDIPQKNIQYFKAFNGYSEVWVENKCYRKDISLNELEQILDSRLFVRVHKQYIINMLFIKMYNSTNVKINEELIPVSRRKQKEFEKLYMNFDIIHKG